MSVAPSDGSQGPPEDPFDETSDVPAEAGGTSESIVTKYITVKAELKLKANFDHYCTNASWESYKVKFVLLGYFKYPGSNVSALTALADTNDPHVMSSYNQTSAADKIKHHLLARMTKKTDYIAGKGQFQIHWIKTKSFNI